MPFWSLERTIGMIAVVLNGGILINLRRIYTKQTKQQSPFQLKGALHYIRLNVGCKGSFNLFEH
jgi:hypothetical protein